MTDLNTPYATRLCLSGVESRRLLDTFRDMRIKHIQVSYYYLRRVFSDPLEFAEYSAPYTTVIIDSGTVYHKARHPDEEKAFLQDYASYIAMLDKKSYTACVYEEGVDLDKVVPDEALIYPLDTIRGVFDDDLEALMTSVQYVGLPKSILDGGIDYLAQIFAAARKGGAYIHAFGTGAKSVLNKWPFYSANTSSWRTGSRYLNTYIYEGPGRGLKLYQPQDKSNKQRTEKELRAWRRRQENLINVRQPYIAPLIEWGALYEGDSWEVDKANLSQWILYAQDQENAPHNKYWLSEEDRGVLNQRKRDIYAGLSKVTGIPPIIADDANRGEEDRQRDDIEPREGGIEEGDIDAQNRDTEEPIDAVVRGEEVEGVEAIAGELLPDIISPDSGEVSTTAHTHVSPVKMGRSHDVDSRMRALRKCDFCSLAGRCPKYQQGAACAFGFGPESPSPDPDNLSQTIRTQMADNLHILEDSIQQLYLEEKLDAAGASKDLTQRLKLWADLVQQYAEATDQRDEVSFRAKGTGILDQLAKRRR